MTRSRQSIRIYIYISSVPPGPRDVDGSSMSFVPRAPDRFIDNGDCFIDKLKADSGCPDNGI